MPENDPLDLGSVDQEIRTNELREQVREGTGGQFAFWEADDDPADESEPSWQKMLAWESLPVTTTFAQLQRAGYIPPPLEDLDDDQLLSELSRLMEELAALQVFFSKTNHLSDRELYETLWHDCLREPVKDLPPDAGYIHHVDLLGDSCPENIELYYRYYANEKDRRNWMKQFPDYTMPEHVDPPYDRDRTLPQHAGF